MASVVKKGEVVSEPTTEAAPPFMARHDPGCSCWPHVSERDAHEAITRAATAEYRESVRIRQEARANGDRELREMLRHARTNIHGSHSGHDMPSEKCGWYWCQKITGALAATERKS